MMPRHRLVICVLAIALLPTGSQAQNAPQLSGEAQVSLITILPGDPVHTFAGHSALRVYDPQQNLDRLYNYGTFDFSDPFFIPKFLYGHLRYFLSVASYPQALRLYQRQGRPVIAQRLALTRAQQTALYRFLRHNARPENRYYQYDFFFDNCSTRIRDALKKTLGAAVIFEACPRPTKSFRALLDEYVAHRPFLDLGFDLALGLPADRTVRAREAMFLPEYLLQAFDHATVTTGDSTRALVAQTDTVQWIEGYESAEEPLNWPFLIGGAFLALVIGWTGWQGTTGRRPNGRGDALLFASIGLVGGVLCFLWFVSTYTVTESNVNLAWAWPTHVVAAYFLARHPSTRGLRLYLAAIAAAAGVLAAGWSVVPQDLHEAVLPVILGTGIRAGWLALLPPLPPSGSPPSVARSPHRRTRSK